MQTSWRPAPLSLPPARPAASRTRAPNSPHVCPSHCTDQRGGPNASTDADQLVARRSSDSAMDGGREERPEAAEASPNHAVHHAQAAQLCQPLASLSDSSLKQPTGAQRASGRASLSREQAWRIVAVRIAVGPGGKGCGVGWGRGQQPPIASVGVRRRSGQRRISGLPHGLSS